MFILQSATCVQETTSDKKIKTEAVLLKARHMPGVSPA